MSCELFRRGRERATYHDGAAVVREALGQLNEADHEHGEVERAANTAEGLELLLSRLGTKAIVLSLGDVALGELLLVAVSIVESLDGLLGGDGLVDAVVDGRELRLGGVDTGHAG